MLFEERLARLILADAPEDRAFTVQLHDDRERDLVAAAMEICGCMIELDPDRPNLTVLATGECYRTTLH